jgi:hypothetical protein
MQIVSRPSRALGLEGTSRPEVARYTNWLNLRQLLEPSGREMGCGSEDFGLKMTPTGPCERKFAVLHNDPPNVVPSGRLPPEG